MTELRPFRGLRYGPQQSAELGAQLSPPFDVISPAQQQELYDRSPHNVVRLELGQITPADTAADNRYTRAKSQLDEWVQQKVLVREDAPAFYVVKHAFTHEGKDYVRWELLAQVKLAEWSENVILPHEFTLPEAKSDRMSLLQATRTNISPIYSLYHDAAGELASVIEAVTAQPPTAEVGEWGIASYSMWAIKDAATVAKVQAFFADKKLYIADGHHRYETALSYRNQQGGGKGDEGHNYVMMSLTRVEDPGLVILPIHRVVRNLPFLVTSHLRIQVDINWNLQAHPFDGSAKQLDECLEILRKRGEEGPAFGMYGMEPATFLTVVPKNPASLRARYLADTHPTIQALDVAFLANVMLHGYLGMKRSPEDIQENIKFTHEAREAVKEIDERNYMVAFFLNPTRAEQVVAVAEAGEKMPQKSTFFYPKLPTGLVLCPLD